MHKTIQVTLPTSRCCNVYAYKMGSAESKKCKGIKKCVVRKTISFEDYKACLFGGGSSYRSQLMFRSLRHEVKTLEVNKLALSKDDDKRITVNGINSLARGNYTAPDEPQAPMGMEGQGLDAQK